MLFTATELHVQRAAFGGLGWPEVLIIVLVVLLLFGGKKLPEIARGTGRALRIFKAETKGLMDDDDDDVAPAGRSAQPPVQTPAQIPPAQPVPTTEPAPPAEQAQAAPAAQPPRAESDR